MGLQKERFFLIDGIRGLAIVNMVIFHFLYDVFIVYGRNPKWYGYQSIHIWQQSICWTFICVSGFVWEWGAKKNLRRGLFLNCCGALISLITWIILPSETVWFGILNFIGCAVLILIPFHKYLEKLHPALGLCISFFLFVLFKNVQHGFLGFGRMELIQLPKWLYSVKILTPLGFPFPGFLSSDYFPLLPWMFLYLSGYFLCQFFTGCEHWKKIAHFKIPLLSTIGQKSIWIYLLHQPLSMLVCILLFH
ncbi:MAG: heparan-alpha-glucosaminide N-acetyltransferase domain-containing protein [Lachnospiraceae bacterium]|nr:heparan-alpha-glucosaminide N-acetyltransferase domain-containing protein [Lachnospiraceae bacterium]